MLSYRFVSLTVKVLHAVQVLILSQRGDWAGCDQALRGLEKTSEPEQGPSPLKDVCDPVTGNTPLMYACAGGHEEVVRVLLEAGAHVEDHNENGHTPLMEAASAGHCTVAR